MPAKSLVIAPQPVFTPRGTPLSVCHRASAAAALGIQADLLTYAEGVQPAIPGVRILRIPRIPLLGPVKVGPSFGKLVRDIVMVFWTVGLLVRHRYPVVHAHEEAVFWCVPLKRLFGFRLIYDMHSSLSEQMENFGLQRWPFLVRAFRWMEGRALRTADAVITISPHVSQVALRGMPDPGLHVLIENSLIDEINLTGGGDPPPEPPIQIPDDRSWVFYAGTLERYQGLDLLIRAFRLVTDARPDVHLVIVGGRPKQISGLRALARAVGVEGGCTFTGALSQQTTRDLARRAAVLTSPRTHGTNTPLKVYELLASGIPMVATRIASHTQVLDPSVCFLADPEPRAFADALLEALSDGPEPGTRVEGALALYRDRYSRNVYVEKLRHVFRMVGLMGAGSAVAETPDSSHSPGTEPHVWNRRPGVETGSTAARSRDARSNVPDDRPPGPRRSGDGHPPTGRPGNPPSGDHRSGA